jgi:hypothetical protein
MSSLYYALEGPQTSIGWILPSTECHGNDEPGDADSIFDNEEREWWVHCSIPQILSQFSIYLSFNLALFVVGKKRLFMIRPTSLGRMEMKG